MKIKIEFLPPASFRVVEVAHGNAFAPAASRGKERNARILTAFLDM